MITYEERVEHIRENVQDVAMQELLTLMLRDHDERPTAEMLTDHPILGFFAYIVKQNVSLNDRQALDQL